MRLALLVLPLLAAAPLLAQIPTTPPGAPDPSRVVAGTYKVDPSHTQVLWQVNHLGFSLFAGGFADATGTLTFDPNNPAAATLAIEIPVTHVVTTSSKLNEHLMTAQFFDGAKFPTATFRSTRIVVVGKTAKITGDLTLHGVTRPVTIDARFIGAGTGMQTKALAMGFEGSTSIKRSDFGLGGGVPLVSDQVNLGFNIAFDKVG